MRSGIGLVRLAIATTINNDSPLLIDSEAWLARVVFGTDNLQPCLESLRLHAGLASLS